MERLDAIAQFVYPPGETEDADKRLNRAILVVMASATSMGGVVWGLVYLLLGVPEVSIWPFGYVVLSALNLFAYLQTKNYRILLYGQLTFILLVPTFLMWHIGGFAASGGVMLWAFLCPSVALVVSEERSHARIWFYLFVFLVVFSGLIESTVAQYDVGMPIFGINAFFVMNFLAPTVTTYFIVYYFIGEGRSAQAAMRAQAEELAKSNESLTELTENLEEQVKSRTQELRDALGNLSAVINSLVDGLVVTDMDGKITNCNPMFASFFGMKVSEVVGRYYHEVFRPEMVEILDRALRVPNEAFAGEVSLINQRIGNATSTAILIDNNETGESGTTTERSQRAVPIGSVTLVHDITREKEVDQMKTNFISTVSHELRTPLTSILGFAKIIHKRLNEVILPEIQTDDKKITRAVSQVDKNLEIIVSESERLTGLINDVLDIAKMEAGEIEWNMTEVSIAELMHRAIDATNGLFEGRENVNLIAMIDDAVPLVEADPDRVLQVMINLISNASKFTDEGSITCEVRTESGMVMVSVKDTGMGIHPDDHKAVFDRFKQVGDTMTDKPKGTGLGLPICKQIIEHHGGRIWVESEIGKGSTFSFLLQTPMRAADKAIDTQEIRTLHLDELVSRLKISVERSSVSKQFDKEAKNILVVDDEENIRELLRQVLEGEGYNVSTAEDGVDAMKHVKDNRPDLIILDVMMPNINGFDVVAMLKSDVDTMGVPVIILSIVEDRDKGYRLGVDRYLTKPLNTDLLFHEIETLLEQGTSKRRVMIIDDNQTTSYALSRLLKDRGYQVVEIKEAEDLLNRAREARPHMVVANSSDPDQQKLIQALRFEKGLEDIVILLYQS